MILKDVVVNCDGRGDEFEIYALGDVHIGARNCAENHVKRLVNHIEGRPKAFWCGGGDYCNCINPKDAKRFRFKDLPDWLFVGNADTVREKLTNIAFQESERFISMVAPIANKCLGLIEGNHEEKLTAEYNYAHHTQMCKTLGVDNLTDAAFLRFRFKRGECTRVVKVFICHGFGGGRTAGAEPNHLYRLASDKNADVVLRGHSHTFCIPTPIVEMAIPQKGRLPNECEQNTKRMANWGCWLKSWKTGSGTYDSRACYPARPLSTIKITVRPHSSKERPEIMISEFEV